MDRDEVDVSNSEQNSLRALARNKDVWGGYLGSNSVLINQYDGSLKANRNVVRTMYVRLSDGPLGDLTPTTIKVVCSVLNDGLCARVYFSRLDKVREYGAKVRNELAPIECLAHALTPDI